MLTVLPMFDSSSKAGKREAEENHHRYHPGTLQVGKPFYYQFKYPVGWLDLHNRLKRVGLEGDEKGEPGGKRSRREAMMQLVGRDFSSQATFLWSCFFSGQGGAGPAGMRGRLPSSTCPGPTSGNPFPFWINYSKTRSTRSVDYIINCSMDKFTELLSLEGLTEEQAACCRDIRRRGKNKVKILRRILV